MPSTRPSVAHSSTRASEGPLHLISYSWLIYPTGQKCSALSRLYVASSIWNNGFKEQLLNEVAKLKVGPCTDFTNFIGPVM